MQSATDNRYAGWESGDRAPGPTVVVSPYENRVKLVSEVLTRNSITTAAEANRLAIQILQAIDHVPERVR